MLVFANCSISQDSNAAVAAVHRAATPSLAMEAAAEARCSSLEGLCTPPSLCDLRRPPLATQQPGRQALLCCIRRPLYRKAGMCSVHTSSKRGVWHTCGSKDGLAAAAVGAAVPYPGAAWLGVQRAAPLLLPI